MSKSDRLLESIFCFCNEGDAQLTAFAGDSDEKCGRDLSLQQFDIFFIFKSERIRNHFFLQTVPFPNTATTQQLPSTYLLKFATLALDKNHTLSIPCHASGHTTLPYPRSVV
ncbi:MAG: hypothetical protein KJ804_16760 [Proteobacteria bacterium]|nr:hypothetical protein [Pseudomonadota bacterium]MBU1059960.1 hypothetical protein [Pseudomonadota bacterium]